jgi:hypothetical protein
MSSFPLLLKLAPAVVHQPSGLRGCCLASILNLKLTDIGDDVAAWMISPLD